MIARSSTFLYAALVCFFISGMAQQQAFAQKKAAQPNPRKAASSGLNIDLLLNEAAEQLKYQAKLVPDSLHFPRSINPNGTLKLDPSDEWTSGFYPGSLWYLASYFPKDEELKKLANKFTMGITKEQYNTTTHDLGFMLFCSFGNGYLITKNAAYKPILLQGAKSLASRYHAPTKVIQSWPGNDRLKFPVIIDNMMNLELLIWAARNGGDKSLEEIAINHANTTLANHFRSDYSSYHVIDYDTVTRKVRSKGTWQGYANESSWARGQGWGLYGYTMMYRLTKNPTYLNQAKNIAKYIMNNPTTPADGVPYWDYKAPNIPFEPRDASAAALVASGLLELEDYLPEYKAEYRKYAVNILKSLSSPAYRAQLGRNQGFILNRSTGHRPLNSEVDTPIVYADYYYIEALLRLQKKEKK